MARSPAIWLVANNRFNAPVGAFTVKHELCTWLWKYVEPQAIPHMSGWKIADGWRHWVSGEAAGPWPLDLAALREEGRKTEESKKQAQQENEDWTWK